MVDQDEEKVENSFISLSYSIWLEFLITSINYL